jgi:hypothetical protein
MVKNGEYTRKREQEVNWNPLPCSEELCEPKDGKFCLFLDGETKWKKNGHWVGFGFSRSVGPIAKLQSNMLSYKVTQLAKMTKTSVPPLCVYEFPMTSHFVYLPKKQKLE